MNLVQAQAEANKNFPNDIASVCGNQVMVFNASNKVLARYPFTTEITKSVNAYVAWRNDYSKKMDDNCCEGA